MAISPKTNVDYAFPISIATIMLLCICTFLVIYPLQNIFLPQYPNVLNKIVVLLIYFQTCSFILMFLYAVFNEYTETTLNTFKKGADIFIAIYGLLLAFSISLAYHHNLISSDFSTLTFYLSLESGLVLVIYILGLASYCDEIEKNNQILVFPFIIRDLG